MSKLYEQGWLQGSIVAFRLEATYLTTGGQEQRISTQKESFERWIVCTQDCDLARVSIESDEPIVELRPILTGGHQKAWGIRSAILRLTENSYIDAYSPRCFTTPRVLHKLEPYRDNALDLSRRPHFKTWLGRRYDRPAVPETYLPLAVAIAETCRKRRHREFHDRIHEILMQFNPSAQPPEAALYAVIKRQTDSSDVEEWLGTVSREIDASLGFVGRIEVGTRSQATLQLLEDSYAADLSQLTWGGHPLA